MSIRANSFFLFKFMVSHLDSSLNDTTSKEMEQFSCDCKSRIMHPCLRVLSNILTVRANSYVPLANLNWGRVAVEFVHPEGERGFEQSCFDDDPNNIKANGANIRRRSEWEMGDVSPKRRCQRAAAASSKGFLLRPLQQSRCSTLPSQLGHSGCVVTKCITWENSDKDRNRPRAVEYL